MTDGPTLDQLVREHGETWLACVHACANDPQEPQRYREAYSEAEEALRLALSGLTTPEQPLSSGEEK